MPHGKRQFGKNSKGEVRHFRLVARSQKDPEGDKEEASPLVLEPFAPPRLWKKGVDEAELMNIPESLQGLGPEVFGLDTRGGIPEECSSYGESEDGEGRRYYKDQYYFFDEDFIKLFETPEAAKAAWEQIPEEDWEEDDVNALDDDCYFPKDGYNYSQHLKTLSKNKKTGGVGGILIEAPRKEEAELRAVAKALEIQQPTNSEEQEVMQALLDADIYEDMDDEFLDELLPGGAIEPEVVLWGQTALEDADLPDLAVFKEMHAQRLAAMAGENGEEDDDEDGDEGSEGPQEAKQVVSAARFEQLLVEEYGAEETGALDDDEIEGNMNMEDMEAMLDEYLEDRDFEKLKLESLAQPQEGKLDDVPRVIEETKAIIERHYLNEDDEDAETSEGESEEDESKNWDCETVLSTLSNLSNRPGKIGKIKLIKKPAAEKELPAIVEDGSDAEESDEDAVELPDVKTERPKDESLEDKKARKAAVKEMRRICRKMKKESKEMYKNEAAKLNKKNGSGDIREKLRCLKL